MTRLSLTMIVKNEEARLPRCLGSIMDLVDEMIVVDTGSTDGTRAIAAQWGAQVHDFRWVDDFSAARNESLRLASGEWIFWLDADEWLDEVNRQRLRILLAELPAENIAYVMQQHSPTQFIQMGSPGEVGEQIAGQVRLFRNRQEIRWRFRVFEQIRPAVRSSGGVLHTTDIQISHSGYEDAGEMRRKMERNLRLALLQDAEQPGDPFTLVQIGDLLFASGRPAEALPYLQRSLESLPQTAAARNHASLTVSKIHVILASMNRPPPAG